MAQTSKRNDVLISSRSSARVMHLSAAAAAGVSNRWEINQFFWLYMNLNKGFFFFLSLSQAAATTLQTTARI